MISSASRKVTSAIVAIAITLLVAACGQSSPTKASTAIGSSVAVNRAIAATAAARGVLTVASPGPSVDASNVRGKTLWVIDVASSVPLIEQIDQGMQSALGLLGAHVVRFDGKGSVSEFSRGINQAIAAHADAIALNAVDPRTVTGPVSQAVKAGIPVVTILGYDPGSRLPDGLTALATYCYTCAGEDMANWIVADSKGHGADILMIAANEQSDAAPVAKGFRSVMSEGCPGCRVTTLNIPVSAWGTSVQPSVKSALTRNPNIKYVVAMFDGMATFAVPAIETSGRSHVKFVTFNGSSGPMQNLASSRVVAADVGAPNAWMGWAAVDQFIRVVDHQPALKDEHVGLRLFDRTNIGSINVHEPEQTWYGADFESTYKRMWGLP